MNAEGMRGMDDKLIEILRLAAREPTARRKYYGFKTKNDRSADAYRVAALEDDGVVTSTVIERGKRLHVRITSTGRAKLNSLDGAS